MRTGIVTAAALALGVSASILAQSGAPEKKPSFEVASIKPSKVTGGGWSSSGGRHTIIGTTNTVAARGM